MEDLKTKEQIMQAVARGWRGEKNSQKTMDSDLAPAIAEEILLIWPQRTAMKDLEKEIAALINKVSREQDSDTPDFILAEYLMACLSAFEVGVNRRDGWYGLHLDPKKRK